VGEAQLGGHQQLVPQVQLCWEQHLCRQHLLALSQGCYLLRRRLLWAHRRPPLLSQVPHCCMGLLRALHLMLLLLLLLL
jgi:hypothetical protein